MGLFLLGIPLGILGAYTLAKDTSKTITDIKIQNAKRSIREQKNQIDKYFVDIVKYCNADCKIKDNQVFNVKKGRYGGMEIYLTQKGYKTESIEYCKKKFDNIADREYNQKVKEAKERIKEYEEQLKKYGGRDTTLVINEYQDKSQEQIEKDTNKLIEYFNSHYNNAEVNIILGGTKPQHNHTATWIIIQPSGYNALDYFFDVCDVLEI